MRKAASVGKSRARRAEEEGSRGVLSSTSDDEVGGPMRAMREQLSIKADESVDKPDSVCPSLWLVEIPTNALLTRPFTVDGCVRQIAAYDCFADFLRTSRGPNQDQLTINM
jgi:hypothetical protein